MEEISELIKIVTAFTKKNLPLLDLKAQEDNENKELNLFLGIKSGLYDSDSAASKGIYGEEEVDFKFRMLKSRLNRKLLNHLFFVDFELSKAHKSNIFYQECHDYLHFSRMLLKLGEVKHASKLAYKTIDLAKECEFYDVLQECLYMLRDIYSATYRPKLFQSAQEEIKKNRDILEKEEEAASIYYESKLLLNSSITNRKKDLQPLHEALERITKLSEETGSINIRIQLIKLTIWIYEQEGKFEDSLDFIDKMENSFRKGKLNQTRFDTNVLKISKLYALLKLGKFSEGSRLAKEYLGETDKMSSMWYSFAENEILFSIRLRDYAGATELVLEVLNNKTFETLDENACEKWFLYAAYLYYFTGEKVLLKKIPFDEIVKQIPEFQKDKAGLNLARLNLQFLVHLDGDLAYLHKILDASDDYAGKYLNNSFSKRTKVFCKLAFKIAEYNRDFEQIIKKSKYLAEKLNEAEIEGDIYADLEIVPYEHLWEHVLKRLSVLRYQMM